MPVLSDIRDLFRRAIDPKASTIQKPKAEVSIYEAVAEGIKASERSEDLKSHVDVYVPKLTGVNTLTIPNTDLFNVFGSTVTLVVGENKTQFVVHKDLLCNKSPFFKSACKPQWLKDNTIQMEDDDPIAVRAMLFWLYYGQLGVPERLFRKEAIVGVDSTMDSAPGLLAKVYALADKCQMKNLMDDTVDALIFWHHCTALKSKIPAKVIGFLIETIHDATFTPFCQYLNYLVDKQYEDIDWVTAEEDLPFDFMFAYCAGWTLLKRKHHVLTQLEAGTLVRKLLSKSMGPRAPLPKKYIIIPDNQEN